MRSSYFLSVKRNAARGLCAVSVQQIHSQLLLSCYLRYVLVQQELKQDFFSSLDIHLPLLVPDLQGEQALFDCPSADLALSTSSKCLCILPSPAAGLRLARRRPRSVWEGDTPQISTWIQAPCWAACSPRACPQGWRDSWDPRSPLLFRCLSMLSLLLPGDAHPVCSLQTQQVPAPSTHRQTSQVSSVGINSSCALQLWC